MKYCFQKSKKLISIKEFITVFNHSVFHPTRHSGVKDNVYQRGETAPRQFEILRNK